MTLVTHQASGDPFVTFRDGFRAIVGNAKLSAEDKRLRVADLIESDGWCLWLCGVVCRKVADRDPDDLAVTVLTRSCNGIRKGNGGVLTWRGAKAYFWRFFLSAAVRMNRAERERRGIPMDAELASREPDPLDSIADRELHARRKELLCLPRSQKQRAVLRLWYEGETFDQIGKRLRMSVNAVRRTYYRGLEEVRRRAVEIGLDPSAG